ncbi:DinB family protein [bacterium]|nr:DinB family protein [bacterium]
MDSRLDAVAEETDRNRATFEAFCRSLSPGELARPVPRATWLVKGYIAHLASIDIWVGDWFEHQADGRRWRPTMEDGSAFDIDRWNEARAAERAHVNVDDLLAEAAVHRKRLWSAVDRFSPDVLDRPFNFRGHEITFLRYLQLWAGHDPAHSADMLRALPERRGDPALKEWFEPYGFLES